MKPTRAWRWPPVLAPVAVFIQALAGRRLLAPSDGYFHYLPLHVVAARAWRHGGIPVWNGFAFSGYPLLATIQAAVFYPPNLLFLVLSPTLANNVTVVASFVLAGAGAFFLARHLCGDEAGAAVAGLSFGLSSFLFAHVGHQAMIASIAWLPWTLLAYELFRRRTSALRLLGASGALVMSLLAGHGQMFFLIVAVLGLYGAGIAATELRASRGRPLLLAGTVVVVALGLSAVQLLPTGSVIGATERSRLSYADATSYSLSKSHAPLALFPYLFGHQWPTGPFSRPYRGRWNLTELTIYPGLAALVLAAAGLGALRKDKRALVLTAVGGLTVLLSFGGSTPLGRLVYALPVYGQFRAWSRYAVVAQLAVGVMAAYGVAHLRAGSGDARRAALRRCVLTAAGVVVAAVVTPRIGAVRGFLAGGTAQLWALAIPTSAAVAAAACCVAMRRAPRVMTIALATVVTLDALGFGAFYEWRTQSPSVASVARDFGRSAPVWGPVVPAPGGIDRYVYAGSEGRYLALFVDATDAKGLASVNGFDPLSPRDYQQAVGSMLYYGVIEHPDALWRPDSRILDLLRVTTVLTDPAAEQELAGNTRLGPPQAVPGTGLARRQYQPRLADAFVVGQAVRVSRDQALAALSGTQPFDPASTALLEKPCSRCVKANAPGPAGSVEGEHRGLDSFDADVSADRQAMVVVSQAWFPGWRAQVDGRDAPVVRVDGVVQGVPVGAGRHHLHLSYVAPGLALGEVVTGLSLTSLLAAVVWQRRRRSARSKASA